MDDNRLSKNKLNYKPEDPKRDGERFPRGRNRQTGQSLIDDDDGDEEYKLF